MALSVLISFDSITADRLTGTLIDNTVYGTGGNPARNAVGVFVTGQKMKFDATVDTVLTVTGNNTSPSTDVSWTFNIVKDGWTRFLFAIVPDYAGGTTYALYDAVRNSTTNVVYRSKQSTNLGHALTDTSWWEVITDPSSLASNEGESNESANIASDIYEIVPTPTSEFAFANQIAIASTEGGDADREQSVQLYELLAVFVDGMYVRSDRSEFSQAERLARRTQTVATEAGLI